MPIQAIHTNQSTGKDSQFGVGDVVRVHQKIEDINAKGESKSRVQVFEGTVLGINNRKETRTFLVRKIGVQNIGVEAIFPVNSPLVERVEVIKEGKRGIRKAKLYYTRDKSRKEIEKIYTRAKRRGNPTSLKATLGAGEKPAKKVVKKTTKKKSTKKSSK